MAYRAPILRGLAVAQMVFGALMIVFGLACIFAAYHWTSHVGFGVWVGIWVSKRTRMLFKRLARAYKLCDISSTEAVSISWINKVYV